MSATNKTLHYELPVYEPDDTTSWLQDFNGAMEKIDATMYAIASQGGGGGVNPIVVVQQTGQSTEDVMSQKAVTDALASAGSGVTVVQTTGESETDVMSQKAVTNALAGAGGSDWTWVFKRCKFGDTPSSLEITNASLSYMLTQFLIGTNSAGDAIILPYIYVEQLRAENSSSPVQIKCLTHIPFPSNNYRDYSKMYLDGFRQVTSDGTIRESSLTNIVANAEYNSDHTFTLNIKLNEAGSGYNLVCNQPWVFLHEGSLS